MPNEPKKIIKVKTKVRYEEPEYFDTKPTEPQELNPENFDYREDALNEEFDNTYVGKKASAPIYKKWWFWLIIALVCGALALLLLNWGRIAPKQEEPSSIASPASSVTTTTETFYETITARNVVPPEAAEVRKGENGKWALYNGNQILTTYNGIASNENGTWYINNGFVDFNYTGYLKVNGATYMVNKGRVDISKPVEVEPSTVAGADVTTSEAYEPKTEAGINNAGTQSQQDALALAVDYINQMAFSRDWLIAQVQSEGYNQEDATWAADHCGADWNEQAYKKALEYLKLTTFTHDDMLTQLQFEGFTAEQAAYGAQKAGL
ncbi:MAG: Ltp family lipoprotein [Clostridia bacterium]|nr:Ltp family lipoprotein [Clostridia bacterium]